VNPLSAIYAIAAGIRNRLYESGVIRPRRLTRPVVSVGNHSVGGWGKNPFVILLGELLKGRGITFDVLSRGYGRASRGVLAVDPSGSVREFGDEPLLIVGRLQCPVVVGEDRLAAGLFAEKNYSSQFHILDDAFQHRSLARDFDIVLLTSDDFHDGLLPTGRLREPLSSLRRADAIVLTEELDRSLLPASKIVWQVKRGIFVSDAPKAPIAFCGIARPQRFFEQLQAQGIRPVAKKFYRDHHHYDVRDVRDLLELGRQFRADGFVTTEKDAINLGDLAENLTPLAVARVTMELAGAADALDTLLRTITERRSGRERISG
jgi:tetraacyldisaccharide 4'-kinase